MLKMNCMKAEEKLNPYGQFSAYIMKDLGTSMRCSIKRKRFRGICMSTVSEKSGLTLTSLRNGKRLAMRNYAAFNAFSLRIIIMEALAYAECQKDRLMKGRLCSAKPVAAEDALLVIEFYFKTTYLVVIFIFVSVLSA